MEALYACMYFAFIFLSLSTQSHAAYHGLILPEVPHGGPVLGTMTEFTCKLSTANTNAAAGDTFICRLRLTTMTGISTLRNPVLPAALSHIKLTAER